MGNKKLPKSEFLVHIRCHVPMWGPQGTDDKNDAQKKTGGDFTPTLENLLVWLVLDSISYPIYTLFYIPYIYISIWLVVSNIAFYFP